jgi:hypothetical protein
MFLDRYIRNKRRLLVFAFASFVTCLYTTKQWSLEQCLHKVYFFKIEVQYFILLYFKVFLVLTVFKLFGSFHVTSAAVSIL